MRLKLRIEKLIVGLLVLPPGLGVGAAYARPELTADLSASTSIATNPYGLGGNDTESGSATVSLSPLITDRSATGSFRLQGRVAHTEYFTRYRSTQSYAVDTSAVEQLSSKVSLHANAGFDSAVYGSNQLLFPGTDSGGVVDPNLPPFVDDITLSGLRERRVSYRAGAGLVFYPTPRDSYSVDLSTFASRYPRNTSALTEYNNYAGTFGYQRQIDSRTNIGFENTVSRVDYLGSSQGDATTFSPRLSGSIKLDPRWSLSGNVGVSITRSTFFGGHTTDTGLAFGLTLCRKGDRSNFCLTGSRSAQPSSIDGVRTQTSIGASYNYKIDGKSDIGITGNYARASKSDSGLSPKREYVNTRVTYNRTLTEKLRGYVAAGYNDNYDGLVSRRGNIEGSIGVTLLLGRSR